MNLDLCLFCNKPKKNYRPSPDTDYICGTCVQLLLNSDQQELERAYAKAKALGYNRKAMAIESFLNKGNEDGKQTKPETGKHRRHLDRRGIVKAIGNKEVLLAMF